MEKFANENLILLEFLVDNVNFEYSVQESFKCMPGETCVAFQFLDNAPIYICEEDFAPKSRNYADSCGGCSTLKNGKSCLFALSREQADTCMQQFDVYVQVFRRMQKGVTPEQVVLGESLISIMHLFQELVYASVEDQTVAKTMKDCFKIQSTTGELLGRIGLYIRLSTFGRQIVTQFRMNMQDKSVEFKAREGHYLFASKANELKVNKHQKYVSESLSERNVYDIPCGKPKDNPQRPCGADPMNCPRPLPLDKSVSKNVEQNMFGGVSQGVCPQECPVTPCPLPPTPCEPICPQINDGTACPKTCPSVMPQYQSLIPRMEQQGPQYPCPIENALQTKLAKCPTCGQLPLMQDYNADYQDDVQPPPKCEYQEFGAEMGGNSITIRVHKANVEQNVDEGCYCDGDKWKPASCRPTTAPEGDPYRNQPFTLKVGNATQASNNISVTAPSANRGNTGPPDPQVDPTKEVFTLRIGKKNTSAANKDNLEIELRTPKGKEYIPPGKKIDTDQQCEPTEEKPPAVGKKIKSKTEKKKKKKK